ncbi:sensor histidine kinase [Patescibacteria group bacterium]
MAGVFILGYNTGIVKNTNKTEGTELTNVLSNPISIAAHELKNPLAILKNYLEVLREERVGKINEKQKEYLGDSLETVMEMLELVREFLEVSKIEENCFQVEKDPVDIGEIIKDITSNYSIWARANNSQILFDNDEDIPNVCTDSIKIRQVIENLISNAIKYKTKNAGVIHISLEKKDENVILTCENNGISIPKDDIPKIFKKFYRSEDAVRMQPNGTGLGLYISRAIVEGSGGRMWVENNNGDGVTFFVKLPIYKKEIVYE